VGRFQGPGDHPGQVVADRVQVDGVLEADGEGGDRRVGVIAGRLNRRSTTRWTRCRTGLNNAAAARVAAATATGDLTLSTCVASSTSPAYTPTSNPVTMA